MMTSQGTMVRGGSLVVVAVVVVATAVATAVVAATATVVVAVAVAVVVVVETVVVVVVATVVVAMPAMAARRAKKQKGDATFGRDLNLTTLMTFLVVTGARSKMRTCNTRGYAQDSPPNQIWPGHQIRSRCACIPPPHQ